MGVEKLLQPVEVGIVLTVQIVAAVGIVVIVEAVAEIAEIVEVVVGFGSVACEQELMLARLGLCGRNFFELLLYLRLALEGCRGSFRMVFEFCLK